MRGTTVAPEKVHESHIALRRRAAAANHVAAERLRDLQATLDAARQIQTRISPSRPRRPTATVVELRTTVESLRRQLASQPVIEQAKGIIMASSHCDEDRAFDILRRASQRTNIKLREVARQIVLKTADQQPGFPAGRLRREAGEPIPFPTGQPGRRPA